MKNFYSYSLDVSDNMVSAEDAVKGESYHCPSCGGEMIPKQGKIRRWHFAHKANDKRCSYETYLHKLAKQQICECFNTSPKFTISYNPEVSCAVEDCPIGKATPCTWNTHSNFDLKQYYNKCDEEVRVDEFIADLILTHTENENRPPILIEICVSHKSTYKKINSKHRIIEIQIKSEEDIEAIVNDASINETTGYLDELEMKPNDKIKFYNFKTSSQIPLPAQQSPKFSFWIDPSFRRYTVERLPIRCLAPNPANIENAKILIQSPEPIDRYFAFYQLYNLDNRLKVCPICNYYSYNGSICILYKSRETNQYPKLCDASTCPHFQLSKPYDKIILEYYAIKEFKITIKE